MNRRDFMKRVSAGATGAAAVVSAAPFGVAPAVALPVASLTCAHYSPPINLSYVPAYVFGSGIDYRSHAELMELAAKERERRRG